MRMPLRERLEQFLLRQGFVSADVRRIVGIQILTAGGSLGFGLATQFFSAWPFFFGVGAVLAAFHIWRLARVVEWTMGRDYTRGLAAANFLFFLLRFALTGLTLYICIVLLKAPVTALAAGLGTPAASFALWGVTRSAGQSDKEASHGR
jgi:hypothetical protein